MEWHWEFKESFKDRIASEGTSQMVQKPMDIHGSIGIGAMIVFIALILVAAVASTIIIKEVEELSQSLEDTTNVRDYSKIEVESVYVFLHEPCWMASYTDISQCDSMNPSNRGHHEMAMHFHVEGDVEIPVSSVAYHLSCTGTNAAIPVRKAILGEDTGSLNSRTSVAEGYSSSPFNQGEVVMPGYAKDTTAVIVETLVPGTSYSVMLDLYDHKNSVTYDDDEGCWIPVDSGINLVLTIDGGMDSYYVVKCDNNHVATPCL